MRPLSHEGNVFGELLGAKLLRKQESLGTILVLRRSPKSGALSQRTVASGKMVEGSESDLGIDSILGICAQGRFSQETRGLQETEVCLNRT